MTISDELLEKLRKAFRGQVTRTETITQRYKFAGINLDVNFKPNRISMFDIAGAEPTKANLTKAMKQLKDLAKERGLRLEVTDVDPDDAEDRKFYKSHGFKSDEENSRIMVWTGTE